MSVGLICKMIPSNSHHIFDSFPSTVSKSRHLKDARAGVVMVEVKGNVSMGMDDQLQNSDSECENQR